MRAIKKLKYRGFTLVELMIVVAIIGVLAALALSNYMRFQLRAKAAEARSNLKAIASTQHGYYSEFSRYLAAAPTPPGAPSSNRQAWAGGGIGAFDQLGFRPTADLYFVYSIDVDPLGVAFTAAAVGDLDGNGAFSEFGYVHPAAGAPAGIASTQAASCSPNGTFSPLGPQLSTPGPCTNVDGTSRF